MRFFSHISNLILIYILNKQINISIFIYIKYFSKRIHFQKISLVYNSKIYSKYFDPINLEDSIWINVDITINNEKMIWIMNKDGIKLKLEI